MPINYCAKISISRKCLYHQFKLTLFQKEKVINEKNLQIQEKGLVTLRNGYNCLIFHFVVEF